MSQVSAAKTDPNSRQLIRDAQRLTRSAPYMSLPEVCAYRPALTSQQLQQSLESLPPRGECARVAARAAQQRPVLATIELCPPSTRRALTAHGADSSGWAARTERTISSRVDGVNCEDPAAGSWTLRSESAEQDVAPPQQVQSRHQPAVPAGGAVGNDNRPRLRVAYLRCGQPSLRPGTASQPRY